MSHTLIGALALAAIVAAAIAVYRAWARRRVARLDAMLAALAPLIGGTVSGGRLHGTYHSYRVETWPERKDPSPSSDGTPMPKTNVFNVRLTGVPGRQYWLCRSSPSLNPFARPGFEITGGALPWPAPDRALNERLRAAGLIEEVSRLGRASNAWLPRVSFLPSAQSSFLAQARSLGYLRRPDGPLQERLDAAQSALADQFGESTRFPGPDATPHEQRASDTLMCEVEMLGSQVPTQEQFRKLLDQAVRLAQINAEANR